MDKLLLKYARESFLKNLLYNNIKSAKEVIYLKKLLNIELNLNTVFVLTIDNYFSLTLNKSELKKQELRLMVFRALEEITEHMGMYVINTSESDYAILLRTEQFNKLDMRKSIKTGTLIVQKVHSSTGISVSIGLGRPYHDIQNLHLSYKEALMACSQKFFLGGSQVIHTSQVAPYSEDLCIFSSEIESELIITMLGCNEEEAHRLIVDLLARSLNVCHLNPLVLKTRLIDITTMLVKVAFETGANEKRLGEISANTVNMLLQADIISDLDKTMKKMVGDIIKEIFHTRKRKNLTAFEKSLKYIQKNYHRAISLEDVANYVNLNAYYFSHSFKSFTGMSFIDYLTKIRIEEAKKLLLLGNNNITAIAKEVGYDNANYFSRVFKNTVGVPPTKYRIHFEQQE